MSITVTSHAAHGAPAQHGRIAAQGAGEPAPENPFQMLFADLLNPLAGKAGQAGATMQDALPAGATDPAAVPAPAPSLNAELSEAVALVIPDSLPVAVTIADQNALGTAGMLSVAAEAGTAPGVAQAMVMQAALPGPVNAGLPTLGEVIRPSRNLDRPASPSPQGVDTPTASTAPAKPLAAMASGVPMQAATAAASGFHFEAGASPSENASALLSQEIARAGTGEMLRPQGQMEMPVPAMTAAAPAATRELELRAHPSSPVWREGFSAQVSVLVGERVQSAEMRVHPPELGPIDIRILTVDEQTSIVFTAAHEDTRRAIEDAMPRLREVLEESGVNLDSTSVNSDRAKEDTHRQAHGEARRGAADAEDAEGAPEIAAAPPRQHEGLIDTFA